PFAHMAGRHVRKIGIGYEKAGITVPDEPIPWNAEAALVDVTFWFPANEAKRKSEFLLRFPGRPPALASALQPSEEEGVFHVLFRVPPPAGPMTGTLTYQNN